MDYGPCPGCMEWLRTTIIPCHNRSCPSKGNKAATTRGGLLLQSNIISGRVSGSASQVLIKEVYPIMQSDKVGRLAQTDPLIKENLPEGWALLVLDFAKNRLVHYQDEIKSAYFGQQQITMHPTVVYYCQRDSHVQVI